MSPIFRLVVALDMLFNNNNDIHIDISRDNPGCVDVKIDNYICVCWYDSSKFIVVDECRHDFDTFQQAIAYIHGEVNK